MITTVHVKVVRVQEANRIADAKNILFVRVESIMAIKIEKCKENKRINNVNLSTNIILTITSINGF